MTFQTALEELAALSVNGVANNYGLAGLPAAPARAQLPALLVMPLSGDDTPLPRLHAAEGFRATAFANGTQHVSYHLTHLLLAAPLESSRGLRAHLPALIAITDAYMSALAADPSLNDTLLEPAQIIAEPGIFTLGGLRYAGCAFKHRWLIAIT